MAESFNTWQTLMEAKQRSSGKEVLIDSSGKRHKVKYRVQSDSKFMLKVINDLNLIRGAKVTDGGIAAIKNFLNAESAFTSIIGQLTQVFFQTNFIVYQILRSSQNGKRSVQKIQFSVQKRKNEADEVLHPGIADRIEFIDAETFQTLSELSPAIIKDLQNAAQKTKLDDPTIADEPVKFDVDAAVGTAETVKERGHKFLYTMRTNSKLYIMTFNEDGAIVANTKDGSDPNGVISYDSDSGNITWLTELDDNNSTGTQLSIAQNYPLFYDMDIDNSIDKEFIVKMFTDEEFRNKIIDEYEAEYKGADITADTLKEMLYYRDGTLIFGSETPTTGTDEPAPLDAESGKLTDEERRPFEDYLSSVKAKLKAIAGQVVDDPSAVNPKIIK